MYSASDLRKGLKIEIDGEPHLVVDFQFSKPGKGQALYKCKLKNVKTGAQFEKTYRSVEKIGKPDLRERRVQCGGVLARSRAETVAGNLAQQSCDAAPNALCRAADEDRILHELCRPASLSVVADQPRNA